MDSQPVKQGCLLKTLTGLGCLMDFGSRCRAGCVGRTGFGSGRGVETFADELRQFADRVGLGQKIPLFQQGRSLPAMPGL